MSILADIAHGNFTAADISFLVGMILFVIAAFLYWPRTPNSPPYHGVLLSLGLAAVALGLLLL
jgi:hypothetical protein